MKRLPNRYLKYGFSILVSVLFCEATLAQNLQLASLGDFKLESGEVVRDCRIGYRTFGKLDASRSNVILFPTWFTGTTEAMIGLIGPQKLIDSSTYFVVAVDALGDGVSSSPSNSQFQRQMKFPKFSIRDLVNSQYQLATEVLRLSHVKAVVGISMGGMQAFQWIVTYPSFMDKAISIVGAPRLAAEDMIRWQAENDAIMKELGWRDGDNAEHPVGEGLDASNHVRQSQAMLGLDVSAPFGGSMERAAEVVKAKVLVIVNDTDHTVSPGPALAFAKLLHAEVVEFNSACGHAILGCESPSVYRAVSDFLAK